ncbi:uncharacterized protein J7T54_001314 [Emericellopsis cladophorae]|uniref:Uncharacterized protein n=1 Tax=Emericellopsis cladophorae TaxID=2686198 RepID=A0A9P9Y2U3_9HYPO|nr:uncharacterized protein J7T54_001314 [Emericellopsis cladophorae]KAI6782457.1 hypothetical protein J7T54_001314 [Emericellopsis cladophorae]
MSQFAYWQKWLQRKKHHFELSFAVYMMTPGEKFAFYSIFFLLSALTFIAIILYLPHHISFLVGRAWYYINGEQLDVGEVVKEMSSSVLQPETTGSEVLTTAGEELLREL